ncbi:hypothetical protein [Corynebacterium sp. Marseille-P4321]|uniref:hypothetical protein n=1 Tax=Corynebacterium sp. Marseille-P4321 TaxID=2736603 RepID=UPI0010427487|nr:hypothetical protein [Corynebacterium sp. Marseille-P4321]
MKYTPVVVSVAFAATLAAPAANAQVAQSTLTVSNSAGNVRCEITTFSNGVTETLCVSDTARQTQSECNPAGQLIPAVAIQEKFVGRKCWNQGLSYQPQKMSPLQVRSHGSAYVLQGFSGNLYVFDTARLALVRAGSANTVLFDL